MAYFQGTDTASSAYRAHLGLVCFLGLVMGIGSIALLWFLRQVCINRQCHHRRHHSLPLLPLIISISQPSSPIIISIHQPSPLPITPHSHLLIGSLALLWLNCQRDEYIALFKPPPPNPTALYPHIGDSSVHLYPYIIYP